MDAMLSLYPYMMYLLYVAAVIGLGVLLIRRGSLQLTDRKAPTEVEAALLRGGMGAVVETLIFKLQEQGVVELQADPTGKKIRAKAVPKKRSGLSVVEQAALEAFTGMQGKESDVRNARRIMAESLLETKKDMQKAGWWNLPTRRNRILTLLAPVFIAVGCLRFIHYYDGMARWFLAFTVPLLAFYGRRVLQAEMSGPTNKGRRVLERMGQEAGRMDPVWQVALQGSVVLAGRPEYQLFCFMTRSIPYRLLR